MGVRLQHRPPAPPERKAIAYPGPYEFPQLPAPAPAAVPDEAESPPEESAVQILRELLAVVLANAAKPVAPTEIHLHIDAGAFKIDATSHVDPGAVVISQGAVQVHPVLEVHPHIDAQTHVDAGAFRVDSPVTVEAHKPVDVEVLRDHQGRVSGLRTVK